MRAKAALPTRLYVTDDPVYTTRLATREPNLHTRHFCIGLSQAPLCGMRLFHQTHDTVQRSNQVTGWTPPPDTHAYPKSISISSISCLSQDPLLTISLLNSKPFQQGGTYAARYVTSAETPYLAATELPVCFLWHSSSSDRPLPTSTTQKRKKINKIIF